MYFLLWGLAPCEQKPSTRDVQYRGVYSTVQYRGAYTTVQDRGVYTTLQGLVMQQVPRIHFNPFNPRYTLTLWKLLKTISWCSFCAILDSFLLGRLKVNSAFREKKMSDMWQLALNDPKSFYRELFWRFGNGRLILGVRI